MDDRTFLKKLDENAVRAKLNKKLIERPDDASYVDRWVQFMGACVRDGLALSDERWSRLIVQDKGPTIRFALSSADADAPQDADFRLGLQLLVGMLGAGDPDRDPPDDC